MYAYGLFCLLAQFMYMFMLHTFSLLSALLVCMYESVDQQSVLQICMYFHEYVSEQSLFRINIHTSLVELS